MMFEEKPQDAPQRRSLLAAPARPLTRAEAIFWNERELRAGWRLAIFALFVFVLNFGGFKLTLVLHLPKFTTSNFTLRGMLFQESVRFLAVLLATAIMGFLESRPLGGYGLPRDGIFRARFWQGAAWGIAMITMVLLLIRALRGFSFGELVLHGSAIWRYAALWGVGFVLVGFFEEYQFRGYPQFTLATGMGFWPAASVLSAVFGAVHLLNPGEDKIGAVSVFVIAMFFCLTLRRTGNLWFAVGLHAAFDWGETFLYSVPDSGLVAPGHLLNSSFHGAAWLTGGSVGPEGSIMAFAVVGLAAVIFARVYPSRTGFSLSGLPNQTEHKTN